MSKRDYIQANKDWLEAKAKEEGVKALPKGIYYKVLSEGRSSSARLLPEGRKNQDSAKPTVRSIITAHYTGRTIDGKQFDSSRGGVPLACRLCDLIEGWIIAIQQMHIGDKWEIYIPAEMGYALGNDGYQHRGMFSYWPAFRIITWRTDLSCYKTCFGNRFLWRFYYLLHLYE